ncbi:proteoglycan 4b isoform X2 [Hippocampus zosterae]|uniref:proteoglycan 4b isoform X2 n=1 Tax=Hippocampus zosterae TaxID=109293 RepID=UPI00223DC65D|nr:proteoglycan 4b isoform X2 [Hippocampus zosterae]
MESDMPDSTGSYASSPAEPLKAIPTQATLIKDTLQARAKVVPSVTGHSQDEVKSTTVDRPDGVTYTESEESRRNPLTVSDSRTTFPQATMGGPTPETSHGSSRPSQPEYPFQEMSTPRLPSEHTQGSSRSSDSTDPSRGSSTSSEDSRRNPTTVSDSRTTFPQATMGVDTRPSQPEYPFQEMSTPLLPSEHTQGSSRSSDSPDPSQWSSTYSALPSASQESFTNSAPQKPTQDSATNAESSEAPHLPDSTRSFPPSVPTTSVVTTSRPFALPDQTSQNYSPGVSPVASDLDVTMTVNPSPTDALHSNFKDKVTPTEPSIAPVTETPKPTRAKAPESTPKPKPNTSSPSMTAAPEDKPSLKPAIKPVDAVLNVDSSRHYQPDDNNDTNLCSGRPPSGVTTLRNGTIAVFRGHLFWFLDRNRVPGPAHDITQMWGVPSPIDTVFTRCNCQGKTYIFKGNQYWRFENNNLDPGYPKFVESGFDGLRGHITAALSVPQYLRRRESVYFFKRGGLVQKYSYQFGTSPSCSKKAHFAIYTVRNRVGRQAVSLLGPAINIRTSWRGFPTIITSAVSVPSYREPEGYRYYVFSRSKSYNIRLDGERPVVTSPIENPSAQNNNFINCPKTL